MSKRMDEFRLNHEYYDLHNKIDINYYKTLVVVA